MITAGDWYWRNREREQTKARERYHRLHPGARYNRRGPRPPAPPPKPRGYPPEVRERARALREDGATFPVIAAAVGVSEGSIRAWLRHTGRGRKLTRSDRARAAAMLAGGAKVLEIARAFAISVNTIQALIRSGELPAPTIALTCSACGSPFYGTANPTTNRACSDRCRRALANASKIAARWRAAGRRVTAPARELMIAQSLLRLETSEGIGG